MSISVPEDYSVLPNSVDPDETQLYSAFHLDLHCLPKYDHLFRVSRIQRRSRVYVVSSRGK